MKYFFGTLALIAVISYALVAHADVATEPFSPANNSNFCNNITAANYDACCTNANTNIQRNACQNYYDGNTPVSGQIGAGSQNTNAVNASGSSATSKVTYSATDPAATACSAIKFKTLLDIAIWVKCIIGSIIIPGIFTLAFVVFLWGVLKFMRSSEQKDKQESKQFIYMGLIGLFVMTSVWGIIKIFATTLGIETVVPTLQTTSLDIKNASK